MPECLTRSSFSNERREEPAELPLVVLPGTSAGVVEEEVIDEEETDMAAYAENVPQRAVR